MFQKTNNTPNTPRDTYQNDLIYIPESRAKINTDISEHQYFHNHIEPNYNITSQFDIQSKNDKRFQTRVDLLLEREKLTSSVVASQILASPPSADTPAIIPHIVIGGSVNLKEA